MNITHETNQLRMADSNRIKKTCYFCEHETDCSVPDPDFFPITEDICKIRHSTNRFSPTDEWVYIENLEKENEELKRLVKLMKCTRITS